MVPNSNKKNPEEEGVLSFLWWLLCMPFTFLAFTGKKLAQGWRLLIAGMDWCWDGMVFLLGTAIGLTWKYVFAPIFRPIGRWLLRYVWTWPVMAIIHWLMGWANRLAAPVRRRLVAAWKYTESHRQWLLDTKLMRPVANFFATLKRVGKVLKPYWLPHGWWSALGLLLVAAGTVGAFFGFKEVTKNIDNITNVIIEFLKVAMADGYMHFALWYALPGVAGLGLVLYVGKKLWPKNANADGLLLLMTLLMLMLGVNTLNVLLNVANGAITDAMDVKDQPLFNLMVMRLLMCFVIGTGVVVLYSFVRNRLALSWRRWYTHFVMDKYRANRNYYRVNYDPTIDNPDERIQQDLDGFVAGALSLLLTILGSIITFYTFIGILHDVDPTGWLTTIAYIWSACFTLIAIGVGARLVKLNFDKARTEADFRYNLIHLRKNVESVAFYHAEDREFGLLKMRFKEILMTWSQLIGWTRNLGFIQTGADYFTVAIPFLILGPLVFDGIIPMGTVGRAAMAFGQVLSALTMIVSEFGAISLFISRVNRLGSFTEKLDTPDPRENESHIEMVVENRMAFENVTLKPPSGDRILGKDINLSITVGSPVVMMGPSGSGKSSMLRALAGLPLWDRGSGRIARPDLNKIMFLPQVPYMLLGSLRDQLLYRSTGEVSDEQLDAVMKQVNLFDVKERYGGYDAVLPWSERLSPGEQQRLAFARLLIAKPEFAILDEATSALDEVNEENVYAVLHRSGIAYGSVGHRPSLLKYHRQVFRLDGKGGWTLDESDQYIN